MTRRLRYPLPKGPMRTIGFVPPMGMCGKTCKVIPHHRLVKQYAQAGDNVYWTGLLVAPEELDGLDDQLRIPPIPPVDPPPVENPRPLTAWLNGGKAS